MPPSLAQRLAAEAIGTALLLATVVGSGIMAESLAGGNVALALLCNALATGAALVALILTFGSDLGSALQSGRHARGGASASPFRRREAFAYVTVQSAGAVLGVWLAHVMFDKPVLMLSQHARAGWALGVSEVVATFGLVCTILGTVAASIGRDSVRRRRLHRRRLLVHGVNLVRQSGGDAGTKPDRHLRRNSPDRRGPVHGGTARRRPVRHRTLPLVSASRRGARHRVRHDTSAPTLVEGK